MILSISVVGFQSYAKPVKIDLSDKLTAIIGDTDTGKTAIIRAIYKLLLNRPLNADYKNWNAKFYEIEITTDKGVVTFHSSDKDNYYQIDHSDDKVYRGYGKGVPDLSSVIRVDERNIQLQLDPHFLILRSGGEIARSINVIGKLDSITQLVQMYKTKLNTTNTSISTNETLLSDYKKELESFPDIVKLRERIDNNKLLSKRIQEVYDILVRLSEINTQISLLSERLLYNKNLLKKMIMIDSLDISYLSNISEKIEILENINNSIYPIITRINNNSITVDKLIPIDSLNTIEIDKNIKKISDLSTLLSSIVPIKNRINENLNLYTFYHNIDNLNFSKLDTILQHINSFSVIKNNIDTCNSSIYNKSDKLDDINIEIGTLAEKFVELAGDLGECPLCYSPINSEHVSEIRNKLLE